MQTSVVDLRYKTKNILKALDRNEVVTLLYHGKAKGKIVPISSSTTLKVQDHPFFGCGKKEKRSVTTVMESLRGPRYKR